MINKQFILKFLKDNKQQLKENYDVKRIGLFGSFSREEENIDSVIDILVDILVDMPSSFNKFFDLKYFLEDNFKRDVDLGMTNSMRSFIKKRIEKDILYV